MADVLGRKRRRRQQQKSEEPSSQRRVRSRQSSLWWRRAGLEGGGGTHEVLSWCPRRVLVATRPPGESHVCSIGTASSRRAGASTVTPRPGDGKGDATGGPVGRVKGSAERGYGLVPSTTGRLGPVDGCVSWPPCAIRCCKTEPAPEFFIMFSTTSQHHRAGDEPADSPQIVTCDGSPPNKYTYNMRLNDR